MTGAEPNTSWLDGSVVLDDKDFVKAGTDLSTENLGATRWPLARPPYLLETSLPGVFAVEVMCKTAASNALLQRLAKDQLQYHLFIKSSKNR